MTPLARWSVTRRAHAGGDRPRVRRHLNLNHDPTDTRYAPSMKLTRKFTIFFAAATTYCVSTVAASPITIYSGVAGAILNQDDVNYTNQVNGLPFPTSQLINGFNGEFFSKTQIEFSGSTNQVTLLSTIDQKRRGSVNDRAISGMSVSFLAETNSTFSISGAYDVTDISAYGYVSFYQSLYDLTAGAYISETFNFSERTSNESFLLGGSGGDTINVNLGALTGTLLQGHAYTWFYGVYTQAKFDHGGAAATGFLRLDINGVAPNVPVSVPDHGLTSVAMLALTLTGAFTARRRLKLAT